MKIILLSLTILFFTACSSSAVSKETGSSGYRNGEIVSQNEKKVVWHENTKTFLTPIEFWHAYAKENGGLTWGQSRNYPNYDDVKEFDLFMVELDSGVCLMEFYHSRWRRANDVRRWDIGFSDISACSDVFN